MSSSEINRRTFIQKSTAAMAALSAGALIQSCDTGNSMVNAKGMPLRTFGKTGLKMPMIGYGCGSQFMLMPDGVWEKSIEYAFNQGLNFFDTAANYGEKDPESSEERLGKVLPAIRKEVIVQTKLSERDPDKALKQFERSLKRLNFDYVDLLLIHAILEKDTLQDIEKGIYKTVARLKEEKLTRFVGFSCHDDPQRAKELIENLEIDHVQMAMNATNYGGLAQVALPAARNKNLGVISMKLMRGIVDKGANPAELLAYNWQLEGVSTNVVAHNGLEVLSQNIDICKNYGKGISELSNPTALERRMQPYAGPHALVWARPDYYDGKIYTA
jgi:uncharacterized protein